MDSLPLLLLLGLFYILAFGGLSLLRREGLSLRFALEAMVMTAIGSGVAYVTGRAPHPIGFLLIVYLITMRVRLLVDIANLFAKRGRFTLADRIYDLGLHLWPDATNRMIVQINQGASRLQQGAPDEAISIFKDVLQRAKEGNLGLKYESAAHYNLGLAYRRKQMDAQAAAEFRAVMEIWPISEYARRAEAALAQKRSEPPAALHDH